jgi:hypothetical protein
MGRSRKIRGGDAITPQELTQIADSAQGLASLLNELAKKVAIDSSVPAAAAAAAAVPEPASSNVVQPDNAAGPASASVDTNAAPSAPESAAAPSAPESAAAPSAPESAAVPSAPESAAAPSAPEPAAAPESAAAPSVPSEPASLLTPDSLINYGRGLTIRYGNISKILENMINNPTKYNKQNKPIADLQTLLTQIQSAKTEVEVSNILRTNGFNAPVGNKGVSSQYFPMTGGTKKRKRTKMTKRRKTRKMKKTRKMRKMRKMRKTMKI